MTSDFFKKLVCIGAIALSSILTACSTTGYQTASHNGKYYWIPENCEQFNYNQYDTDTVYCIHKGVPTGVSLTPANPDDVYLYNQQQAQNAAAFNQSLESLRKSSNSNRTARTNCMNLGYGQISCVTY